MSHTAPVIPLHPPLEPAAAPALERTDDQLMLLARGGRMEAFDALVRRHQAAVLRMAMKELADPSLAKDVAQATFLEVHAWLHRYEPQGKFKAFLYRVLLNQCRMAGRKRSSWLRMQTLPASPEVSAMPEDRLLERERRREVDRALGTLSPKLRSVLLLRFAADLSYQEIAEASDVPVGTVKSRISLAMAELKRRLTGEEEP
jgi:RNA polymerase sigma-70 factor (ECF subfamily)